jgi:hypothetical protein
MARDSKTTPPGALGTFTDWHPVLRPMCAACERFFDAGDMRAWNVLHALIVLNAGASFRQSTANNEGAGGGT